MKPKDWARHPEHMTDDAVPETTPQPGTPPYAPPSYSPPSYDQPYGSAPYSSPSYGSPQPPPWPPQPLGSPRPQRRPSSRVLFLGALFAAGGLAGFGVASGLALTGGAHSGTASVGLPGNFSTPNAGSSDNGSNGGGSTGNGSAPSAPASGPANASAIAQAIDPAVVDINGTLSGGGQVAGTGMILTSSGIVLTNNHVIEGTTSLSLQLDGTGTTYSATVLGTDPTADIAVLQMNGASHLTTVPLGDSSSVSIGDSVVAIGNALGAGGAPAVTTGSVTALDQTITAGDSGAATETLTGMIQMDAFIQPGDSGGPLVNANGKIVGIDAAAQSAGRFGDQGSNIGYAIPINSALSIARQIEAGHASSTVQIGTRGVLGVEVSTTAQPGSGADVTGVQPGSPAARAGLAAGDLITSIDGQSISDNTALTTAMTGKRPGQSVTVGWTDPSGGHRSATVQLEAGPPA